jgi:CHAT domain-containing protein/tetratricopeptide (TPR) repeat protein
LCVLLLVVLTQALLLGLASAENDADRDPFTRLPPDAMAAQRSSPSPRPTQILHEIGQLRLTAALLAADPKNRPRQRAEIFAKLGGLQAEIGELRDAIESYQRALGLIRQFRDGGMEAQVLLHLGSLYRNMGDLIRAQASYLQALERFRNEGARAGEAMTLSALGQCYLDTGEFQKALDALERARALSTGLWDRHIQGSVAEGTGRVYAALGKSDRAREYFLASLAAWRETGNTSGEARVLLDLGGVDLLQGRTTEASIAYGKALELWRKAGSMQGEAASLLALAEIEFTRRPQEALRLYQSAEALFRENPRARARALCGMAALQSAAGNTQQSLELYREALRLEREVGDPSGQAQALLGMARAERRFGQIEQARAHLEEALALIEAQSATVANRDSRASFLSTQYDAYELYISILMQLDRREPGRGYAVQAFEASDRTRARSFLAQLHADRGAAPRHVQRPMSLSMVQRQVLDADTVLLEYSLGEERSFLWAVTSSSFSAFTLPARAEIENQARRAYDLLSASNHRMAGATADLVLGDLGRLLLGPVLDQLAYKRLAIVADGALQYIPFAVLPDPAHPEWRLVEEHEIVAIPSASVLAAQRQAPTARRPAPKMLALFADPVFTRDDERFSPTHGPEPSPRLADATRDPRLARLPRLRDSRIEAESILRLVPPAMRFEALGFEANRNSALDASLSQYRILHFATHSFVNSQHPELSGLVLSLFDPTGKPREGFLKAYEINDLSLPVDLVVLGACRTALGKDVRGEGLLGLTRAFLSVGARQVVSGLWGASDRGTAELMVRFYREMLSTGLSPSAALRAAQISMLRDPQWASPYYWAGMVLQGDWRQDRPLVVRAPSFVAAGEAGP